MTWPNVSDLIFGLYPEYHTYVERILCACHLRSTRHHSKAEKSFSFINENRVKKISGVENLVEQKPEAPRLLGTLPRIALNG